jgi:hypothetical protein
MVEMVEVIRTIAAGDCLTIISHLLFYQVWLLLLLVYFDFLSLTVV